VLVPHPSCWERRAEERFLLSVLTNGRVPQDKAGPHAGVLAEFAYVGLPHHATLTASRIIAGAAVPLPSGRENPLA
jgi:hypothetical protein